MYYSWIQQVTDGNPLTKKAMTVGINRFMEKRNKKFCFAKINVEIPWRYKHVVGYLTLVTGRFPQETMTYPNSNI